VRGQRGVGAGHRWRLVARFACVFLFFSSRLLPPRNGGREKSDVGLLKIEIETFTLLPSKADGNSSTMHPAPIEIQLSFFFDSIDRLAEVVVVCDGGVCT
jgi:hypothetical protein